MSLQLHMCNLTKYFENQKTQRSISLGSTEMPIIDNSPIAFYSCNLKGEITYFNRAAEKEWGRKPLLNKDLWCGAWQTCFPDGTPLPLHEHPAVKAISEGKFEQKTEVLIKRQDGSLRNLLVIPQPQFNSNNKLIGGHFSLVDCGGYAKDHVKQATLSAIVESSDDAIVSKNLNGIIMSWNRGAQDVFGYSEKEAIGKSITMLIPEDRLQEESHILGKIGKGEKVDHFETIRKHKSGKEIAISLTVSPIKDHKGNIIGASKVARDITPQVQAKEALKNYTKNLEVLQKIGKSLTQSLEVRTILQRITHITTSLTNSSLGGMLYNYKNKSGEKFTYFTSSGVAPEDIDKLKALLSAEKAILTKKEVLRWDRLDDFESKNSLQKELDEQFDIQSLMVVPIVAKSGTVIANLLLGSSESDHYSAKDDLLMTNIAGIAAISLENSGLFEQVSALSAKKDEFIALASHELKTPLTTVKGYLQLLSKMENDEHASLFVKKSLNQVEKLNHLIEDILNMSRIEKGKLQFNIEKLDLRELLLDVAQTFSYSSKTHKIETRLGKAPVEIEGDVQRIEQVILNLLTNAVKYSPDADKIEISLEVFSSKVMVKIKDYGIGLTRDEQNKLFARFYRAEGVQGISGLGLGLYIAKLIIDRHKGEVGLTSEYGEGSEFYFSLPKKQ